MLTVTPKQLESYASRMLNPLRDLLNDLLYEAMAAPHLVELDPTAMPFLTQVVTVEAANGLLQVYQDIGALLAILQGYIAREADFQQAVKVLTGELSRLGDMVPEETFAQIELETEQAFEGFRQRLDEWKADRVKQTGYDSQPEVG